MDFQLLVNFKGSDVLPISFVYNDTQNRSGLAGNSLKKRINNALDPAGFDVAQQGSFHGIDAGEEAALCAGMVQSISEVADFAAGIRCLR